MTMKDYRVTAGPEPECSAVDDYDDVRGAMRNCCRAEFQEEWGPVCRHYKRGGICGAPDDPDAASIESSEWPGDDTIRAVTDASPFLGPIISVTELPDGAAPVRAKVSNP